MYSHDSASSDAALESWQTYRYLADNAIDVILEASLDTTIRWMSPSVDEVLGWQPQELVGRTAGFLVHPDDIGAIMLLAQALNEQAIRVRTARCRILTAVGTYKPMELRGRPALDHDGTVVGHVITMQDTSDRDDALRALSVLSEGNRVLARADDETDLLQQMCDTVVSAGQYLLAWYGRKIDDEARTVAPVAWAGPEGVDPAELPVSWGEGKLGIGPTGVAIRTDTTQVRHDIAADHAFAPRAAFIAKTGIRSAVSLPVRIGDHVDGALIVCSAEPDTFDERATHLLETLASDLGLGLERLQAVRRLDEKTREAEEQRARLQGVLTSQFDPFVLLEAVRDQDGNLIDLRYAEASDAALEHNGLTREQMIGATITQLFPGQRDDGTLEGYFHTLRTGEPVVLDDYEYFHEQRQQWRRYDIRAVKSGDAIALEFRDVTERFLARERLAESEARYRLLAENSSDVVWQSEPGGRLTWVSESATGVLGWLPDELVGRGLELMHPDDLPEIAKLSLDLERGLSISGEGRIQCHDGSWRWMSYNVHRVATHDSYVDIAALHDIDDEVRARTALDHALGHDPLTGLAARPAMLTRVDDVLSRLTGPRDLGAVLCVGVDRLAAINDAFTHAGGDVVLTRVAARIADAVGNPDLVGRGSGVEFLVLVPSLANSAAAAVLADRILSATKGTIAIGEHRVDPTVSIGIAIGGRGSDPEQLVRDASTAMGQAKADGRDRYAYADAALAGQAQRRLSIEASIREMLDDDRFVPYFQPIVNLSDRSLAGYEALARAIRQDGSVSTPGSFIPIAELSPLICELDIVMLRKSLTALKGLPAPLTMSVNVSTATLTRPGYPQLIIDAVREADIDPTRLHVEVTETTLLGHSTQVVDVMGEISTLGVQWYVDDFGTGYSSIAHLRDLPIAGLKLDLSFSAGIREGHVTSARLAQGLAGLSTGLALDTVAEGVETELEADVLRSQGWVHGQGWLFGRPAPLP